MKGKLWWIAENEEELEEWAETLFKKDGVSVINLARIPKDGDRIQVIIEVEKLLAKELLGYVPEEEEWLTD